ncbi:hypothetical protein Cob_v012840 [Colletotrichum orbiculare MAFF 240422]|uniref:Uncharacterized protein n=1 Tax=Colletotrichum orbiculare (strain 104-T / ATCC 96160 / CBS 514.97 / LARS 414 / MAFF 240422) TaxID=1213857 RepID=A0A484F8M6_COLOR|nr:hypothetical protein Cob_v012840 [Colletotrichum orbiculare MAFF 240422]
MPSSSWNQAGPESNQLATDTPSLSLFLSIVFRTLSSPAAACCSRFHLYSAQLQLQLLRHSSSMFAAGEAARNHTPDESPSFHRHI